METKKVEYGLLPGQPLGEKVLILLSVQGWRLVVLINGRPEEFPPIERKRQMRNVVKNMMRLEGVLGLSSRGNPDGFKSIGRKIHW